MPRRYYRRYRRTKRKYSVQQKAFGFTVAPNTTTQVEVVPETSVEGMRKVKNLTVTATVATTLDAPLYWALVYVPQGTTPNALSVATTTSDVPSLYEPNQFVMNCGISDSEAGPIRIWTPLSRNLNDGDRIFLLIRHLVQEAVQVRALVRYAIAY